jgi:hypothetical protein
MLQYKSHISAYLQESLQSASNSIAALGECMHTEGSIVTTKYQQNRYPIHFEHTNLKPVILQLYKYTPVTYTHVIL